MIVYGYNEYIAHHYAYMSKVVEVREPKSDGEASQDAKWRLDMEEEMQELNVNQIWDLVDPP